MLPESITVCPSAVAATSCSWGQSPLTQMLALWHSNSRIPFPKHSWQRKRQATRARRRDVRFNDVISRIANSLSDGQVLSVPVEMLDDGDLIEGR